MKLRTSCLLLLGALQLPALAANCKHVPAPEARGAAPQRGKEVHLLVENDLFAEKVGLSKSDRWYTSGVKLIYKPEHEHPPFIGLLEALSSKKRSDYQMEYGFTLGQMMFTPSDISQSAPQPHDRYWGGWLYFGTILQAQPCDARELGRMSTMELDVGMLGPWSLAQQSQKAIHKLVGAPMPNGWNNQLKSELGFQFSFNHQRRIRQAQRGPLSFDLIAHAGFGIGTMFDYVNGGLTLRIGNNLEEAPVGSIEMPSLMSFGERANRAYLLARIDSRYSVHNTFLQGSMWRAKPHESDVRAKSFTTQATLGVVVESREWRMHRLAFLFNRRSAEFNNQPGTQSVQNFATVMVQMDF
ncbi:lipid A deacylase LpxR family protein [Massilia sp. W12]|uniref:lipid A deacylase LpxR family protein n=1 Tax=Massilia sp. W12 TaxID=3126507 RepID=UPI0030D1FA10